MKFVGSTLVVFSIASIAIAVADSNIRGIRRPPSYPRNQRDQEDAVYFPGIFSRVFGGGQISSQGSARQFGGAVRVAGGQRFRRRPLGGVPRRRTSVRPTRSSATTVPVLAPMKSIITPVSQVLPPITAASPSLVGTAAPLGSTFIPTPPQSLEGWLSHPTEATALPAALRNFNSEKLSKKAGVCGNSVSFGIYCKARMDQCVYDADCPGQARCCMVGDCGNLCVKPKATKFDGPQKRKRLGASNVLRRQNEEEKARIEISTTAMGLKIDDIARS